MNSKTLAILAGASIVVVGAAFMMNKSRTTTATESTRAVDEALPLLIKDLGAKAPTVAKITLKQGAAEAVLTRTGDEWVLASKSNFPARLKSVSDLVSWLAQARVQAEKTSRKELYAKIGVEDPAGADAKSTLVTLADAFGAQLAAVIVGNQDGEKRFVRMPDQPASFLVSGSADVSTNPLTWVDTKVMELPSPRMSSARFSVPNPGGEPLVCSVKRVNATDNTYIIENAPADRKAKDQYAASRAAQCLAFTNFEDVRPAQEVNFDTPDAATAEFRTLDNLVVRTTTVLFEGKQWTRFAAAYEAPTPPAAAPATPPTPAPGAAPAANGAASIDQPAEPAPAEKTPEAAPAPEDPKVAEVRAEAEELNKKFAKWVYALPEFTTSRLKTKLDDLLAPPEAPPPVAPGVEGPAPK